MTREFEEKAKEIAWNMFQRGLYPWHAKDIVQNNASIPRMYWEEMEELVYSRLEELRGRY